ncbi:hypothetical protein AQS8620_02857 [Aquimixticola soesokkakensis]|uniref:DUF2291 domain-containing protein n=1 Tax=Aquimixticola soesokkakensis TaxID=1519096 RepID=A0A1Y5TIG9_9RHOB|nr:DUF2291 family protein [Aquimixticola soesokkakensis]SLN62783.1 hypothetical protein AQS8620_02857 [Aquimixticola soesokkakensis]
MTTSATPSQDARVSPKGRGKARFVLPLCAVALLGAIALDTKVVHVGSQDDLRVQAFNPDSFGTSEFPRIRDAVLARAQPAGDLAAAIAADKAAAIEAFGTKAGMGAVMPVTLTGTLGDARSGVFDLTVAGVPDTIKLRVQTGPAINGTDLRDITGDIAFGQFTNQIEYQDAGAGLNRAMAAEVLQGLERDSLSGRTVTLTGAFTLINPRNWMITPVAFEVQP